MTNSVNLEQVPMEDLLSELRLREERASEPSAAGAAPAGAAPSPLDAFDPQTLANAVRTGQRVIYGTDDRQEVFQLGVPDRNDADPVVAIFPGASVTDNGDGTSSLGTIRFGDKRRLCADERFVDEPTGANCTGFLVAPDVVATAGHCVDMSDVTTWRFVFGFRMVDLTNAATTIDNTEIYTGRHVIARQLADSGEDWALVRLDRAVTGHNIARIRRAGQVPNRQAVHVIGHPSGLPTKFAGGATVRDNTPALFFVANLDSYGGNSGSPVFNSDTREVEGILVRGNADFVAAGGCNVSLICPSTGCRGEDVTRTTLFAAIVPPEGGVVPDPTLRRGARGVQVLRLQQALANVGFDPGPLDGIYLDATVTAVRAYQTARGLGVDGAAGSQTWGALHADGQ
jgi:hypothetical protein